MQTSLKPQSPRNNMGLNFFSFFLNQIYSVLEADETSTQKCHHVQRGKKEKKIKSLLSIQAADFTENMETFQTIAAVCQINTQ